ncbi:MAG: hypothetical protein ACSHYB_19605 [Roseibacillus sp.]
MMKVILFAVYFMVSGLLGASEEPIIKPAKAVDGVFFTYGMHNQVIELKDGRFRYWFNSDRKGSDVEGLEGTFKIEGNRVILSHPKLFDLVANWEVLSVDGVVTLWRSDALKFKEEGKSNLYSRGKEAFFKGGGGSILVPSKLSAEKTWAPAAPMTMLTEEQVEENGK